MTVVARVVNSSHNRRRAVWILAELKAQEDSYFTCYSSKYLVVAQVNILIFICQSCTFACAV